MSLIQNVENVFDLREKTVDFFRDYSFLLSDAKFKAKYGRGFKILTTKQMLQKALAQVQSGNTSENVLNEIRQIIYSLYRAKEIAKKVYSNIINLLKLWNRLNTISTNSENIKTFDRHRLLLNLSDKINLKRSDKYVALSNLSIYYSWKNVRKSYKNNKLKLSVT